MKINIFKKIVWVFLVAFILNLIWENFHSVFYVQYKQGSITELILLKAAIWDAVVITILVFLSFVWRCPRWAAPLLAFLIALGLEWFALSTGRWAYNSLMPIIPILEVGLTPIIQLPILTFFSCILVFRKNS